MTEKQLQWFTVLQSAEWKVNGRKKERRVDEVLQTGRNDRFVVHVNPFCHYGCSEVEKNDISFLRVKKKSYLFSINTSPSKRKKKKYF